MASRCTDIPVPGVFAPVTDWVFDLDNTLYPRETGLFVQIDRKMTAYVANLLGLPPGEARRVQKDYYRRFGTTLNGLMRVNGIDPNDFLHTIHDIDYSPVRPDLDLGQAIRALPGRKFVFTNGNVAHARRTMAALGILDRFDAIFDIVAAGFTPKPAVETYRKFLSRWNVDARRAAMFEDLPRNLTAAKSLGMRTVLVVSGDGVETNRQPWEREGRDGSHIDHVTGNLTDFLRRCVAR